MINLNNALERLITVVTAAGDMQKQQLGRKDLVAATKSTGIDLVTEVDMKSEQIIVEAIKSFYPDHAILAEESGLTATASDYRWVVDPLDGTTNYAQGLPIFTISVALQYRGSTVLGLVYAPVLGELFSAIRGQGAYLNNKKLTVSAKTEFADCVLATGFPYDIACEKVNNIAYFQQIAPKVRGIRRLGSAALDAAYTAAGRFDGYWELKLSPWDVAAGLLLVEEAGGETLYFREDRGVSVICGNKTICRLIQKEITVVDETGMC